MESERKRQAIFACLFILGLIFIRTDGKLLAKPNAYLSQFSSLKLFLAGYTVHYIVSHFLSLVGFGAPDLPEHHYRKNFVLLRKLLTGLDAGIVSTLHLKPKWLRYANSKQCK